MKRIDLKKALFILPNLFTLSSVLCGFIAILTCTRPEASDDDFYRAALLIVFGMFFDTIDGRVARLTKTQSAIGVQLDSLADVISFGVAPATLVYRWSLQEFSNLGLFICFAYIACGAIRLARFNVLTMSATGAPKKPGKYIMGLPIPAAAGILISLVVANTAARQTFAPAFLGSPELIMGVVIALSFFMVSSMRFRSFKDLSLNWRTGVLFSFAVLSTIAIARFYHISIALIWLLACYVLMALVETALGLAGRGREEPAEAGTEA